jgi:transposase InsO family protein
MAPSSYYYRPVDRSSKQAADAELVKEMERIVLEFNGYGYRRVAKHFHRQGKRVNHKRVLRLMRENGLTKKPRRRFVRTTDSRHGYRVYPNLIKGMDVVRPNQVWVSDITYVRLPSEFVYLAAILDKYSRKAVGYALSANVDSLLTLEALEMAIADRNPTLGCIHHSDRGVQYASDDYIARLEQCGFRISMSRKGNPYDNAEIESFFKTLKCEEVYLWEYRTLEDARIRIESFIKAVYNKKRLHSSLGYVPPEEFEMLHARKVENRQTILTQTVQS